MALPPLLRDDGHVMQLVPVVPLPVLLAALTDRLSGPEKTAPFQATMASMAFSPQQDACQIHNRGSSGRNFVKSQPSLSRALSSEPVSASLSAGIVLLSAGAMWASGVVVDASRGIIVTNAHVLRAAPRNTQLMALTMLPEQHWSPVDICFVSDTVPDVAVLQLKCVTQHGCRQHLAANRYRGDVASVDSCNVLACGYPLLEPLAARLPPSTTAGTVSCCKGPSGGVEMLHASAVVYPGSSGGGLFLAESGELIGILTSYSQFGDNESFAVFPRLAFCVPVSVLSPLWVILDRDVSCGGVAVRGEQSRLYPGTPLTAQERRTLASMEVVDPAVRDMWALVPQAVPDLAAVETTWWASSKL